MGSHCQIRQKVTITAAPAAGLGGGGQVAGDCQQGTELVCVMFYGQDANTGFSCPEAEGFTLRDSVQPQVQADPNPSPSPSPAPAPAPLTLWPQPLPLPLTPTPNAGAGCRRLQARLLP